MKRISSVILIIGMALFAGRVLAFTVADKPLFVTGNVEPNIILTLDDSGSMSRAFTPDVCDNPDAICANSPGNNGGNHDTRYDTRLDHRYLKSNHYNPLYYNPAFIYRPPTNANGVALATAFAAAHINGYDVTLTLNGVSSYDLASNYRPSAGLYLRSGANNAYHQFMRHYASDVRCKSGAPDNDRCQYRQADGSWITYSAVDCDSDNDNDAGEDDGYCRRVAMPAYYYVYDASNGGCNGSATDNDCYDIKIVGNASGPGTADLNGDGVINADDKDERQNFANWYSFYRTRNLSAVAGAALAFSELDPSARVAWQSLNSCADTSNNNVLPTANCAGWKNNTGSNTINSFSAAGHKQKFYNWLFQLPTYSAGGGTPLRRATIRAGKYYSTSGEGSPYDNDFSAANSGEYTCRRNFHVLMTDGIWNDDVNTGNYDNKDWTGAGALPDATEYNYQQNYARIFRGATANTLADIAFNYWATDLRPGLANSLISVVNEVDSDNNGLADANQVMFWNPKNNPATWQHMINYTIGLGLTGFFQGSGLTWAGDTYSGSYSSIKSGFLNWPATSTDGGLVADLWHAAVNSRGEFFSADTPDELVTAFSSVMTQIKKATPSSAALAANSTKAEIGTRVYQAKFGTAKWNGHLYAYDVNPADGSLSAAVWDAATVVPAHGNRNLYTWNGNDGVGFQWANLTLDQQTALNTLDAANDGGGAQRLAWLRGDPTNETHNPGGVFRSRKIDPWDKDNPADPDHWVLGDIISSDPAYVGVGSQGYHLLPNGAAGQLSYAGYVSTHKAARTPAIYVGANDGMLHAFRVTDGVELFAVIPNAAFPNLSQLTDPNYEHRFFVNGSPGSGDAYLNNALSHASGWNTVVATGLGAGGNSVIAVDATRTDVTSADQFMWEYTEADMGMTYSQPQIVRLNDGSWAAVFGNGYKTSDGGAYLYLVNLADGSLIRKITASAALAGTDNGLSTPVLVDANSDMIMDYAYAGDLQGNLWKFDLSDPNAANWTVANGGTALFVAKDPAGNRQPITVQPTASKETNAGFWIFFGTGRYFADEDVKAAEMAKTQSFYGIWDNGVAVPAYANRTDVLVEQTIVTTAVLGGYEVRATSNNAVVLGVNVRGWFMDLPGSGERVVSRAVSVVSNVNPAENRIVFVTILPSSDPCDAGGTSWLMELLFTGGQPAAPVFDLNNDGVFDDADKIVVDGNAVPVSGVKSNVGIMATPTWLDKDAEKAFKLVPGTSGGVMTITNKGKGGSGTTTRVYWQQLL